MNDNYKTKKIFIKIKLVFNMFNKTNLLFYLIKKVNLII